MVSHVNIQGVGMVTAVGLSAKATCAAMRAGVDGFQETQFIGPGGEPLLGATAPIPPNWVGEKRLAHLAAGAIVDALNHQEVDTARVQIVICLAEKDRPGRPIRNPGRFARRMLEFSGLPASTKSHVVEHGRPSGIVALERVRRMFHRGEASHAIIVGVDSLLNGLAIAHFLAQERLLSADQANGFIPGEAAAALLCSAGNRQHFALLGLGLARERAYIYNFDDEPLRGDGMTEAYKAALESADCEMRHVEYRVSDMTGEAYFFKQSALASQRLNRGRSEFQALWTPTDIIGNVGAAAAPLMIGWAFWGFEKGYHPGTPVLIETSNDMGECGAAIFKAAEKAQAA